MKKAFTETLLDLLDVGERLPEVNFEQSLASSGPGLVEDLEEAEAVLGGVEDVQPFVGLSVELKSR